MDKEFIKSFVNVCFPNELQYIQEAVATCLLQRQLVASASGDTGFGEHGFVVDTKGNTIRVTIQSHEDR